MRKPTFCICENKGADQLHRNCEAYLTAKLISTDRTIPILPKFIVPASCHLLYLKSSVCVKTVRKPHCWFSHEAAYIFPEMDLGFLMILYLSLRMRKPTSIEKNRPVQSRKEARSLKFRIYVDEGLFYPCSENKGADQLCSYCTADLRLWFRICRMSLAHV